MSALTKMSFKLLGFLKAKTGGLNIAPKVFRTVKLSESNASAPTNKPPKNGLGN
jgi:hypothetical protein